MTIKKVAALFSAVVVITMLSGFQTSQAQLIPTPPCWEHTSLVVPLPRLDSRLPLETGMPFDVIIGYIVFDSLARNLSVPGIDNIYTNLTYSDTLRYAMKYCYKMADYNPVLFEQFQDYNEPPRRAICRVPNKAFPEITW